MNFGHVGLEFFAIEVDEIPEIVVVIAEGLFGVADGSDAEAIVG